MPSVNLTDFVQVERLYVTGQGINSVGNAGNVEMCWGIERLDYDREIVVEIECDLARINLPTGHRGI